MTRFNIQTKEKSSRRGRSIFLKRSQWWVVKGFGRQKKKLIGGPYLRK